MKRKTKMITVILAIGLVGVGGYLITVNDNLNNFFHTKIDLRSEKEQQLDFLKEHEDRIIIFVKSLNPKIESVQIDWEETTWEKIGNGTPWGAGDVISIYGTFNHIEDSSWSVLVSLKTNNDGKMGFDTIMEGSPLRIGGKEFD